MEDEHCNRDGNGDDTKGHGHSIAAGRACVFIDGKRYGLGHARYIACHDDRGPEFTQSPGKHEQGARDDSPHGKGRDDGYHCIEPSCTEGAGCINQAFVYGLHAGADGPYHQGKAYYGRCYYSGLPCEDKLNSHGLQYLPYGAMTAEQHEKQIADDNWGQGKGKIGHDIQEDPAPEPFKGHDICRRKAERKRQQGGCQSHLKGQEDRGIIGWGKIWHDRLLNYESVFYKDLLRI